MILLNPHFSTILYWSEPFQCGRWFLSKKLMLSVWKNKAIIITYEKLFNLRINLPSYKTDLITLITKTLTGHHKVAQINGECRCKLKTKQRDLGDCKTTDRLTSTKIALWVDFKMEFKSSFELRFWSTIDKSDQKFVLWLWRSGRWSAPEEELWLSRVVHICHVPLANVNTDRSASVATDEQFTMLAKRSNRVWL